MASEIKILSQKPLVAFLEASTNVGIVAVNGTALIIDSGVDARAGKSVLQALRELGLRLGAIAVTHGHADHFGANQFLVRETGALVYAPVIEEAILRYPLLGPLILSGGALPLEEMKEKIWFGPPGPVDRVLIPGQRLEEYPVEVIPLPGHTLGHCGYLCGDILFAGDALFEERLLVKHRVTFLADPPRQLESLDRMEGLPLSLAVPSHGPAIRQVKPAVDVFRRRIDFILDTILASLSPGAATDEVVLAVARAMDVSPDHLAYHNLFRTSVLSYLSFLRRQGRVEVRLQAGLLAWSPL